MQRERIRQGLGALAMAVAALLSGCLSGEEVDDPAVRTDDPAANSPPTIGGDPSPAVMVGNNYSFTPSATDPDGDNLAFSVSNLPSWASFDPATGTISGTVSLGDVGTYANIVVSVSDGTASAQLGAFSIDVSQVALGSATLSWNPPTQNTDGTTIQALSGYRIYVGTNSGIYTREIYINNPGISTYVVDNLVPDTYYFASTAINSLGVESEFSAEAVKSITAN